MTEISKMLAGCNSSEHSHRQCKDYAEEIGKFPAFLAVGYGFIMQCVWLFNLLICRFPALLVHNARGP